MRRLVIAVLTAAGIAAPQGVRAADALTIPVSTAASVPVSEGQPFDWNGFYAGLYGVAQNGPVSGFQYGAGLVAGVNAQIDFFLIGGEVAFQGLAGGAGNTGYAQILARGGLVVNDGLVAYAAAGYGINTGAPVEDNVLVGGGLEFAVADDVSVRAQYLHGFPITGANPIDQVTLGANFHF